MAGKVSRSSLPTDPDIIRGRLVAAGQLNKSFTPSAPENTDTSESLQTMLTSFLLWFWLQLLCSENIKLVDHLIIRSKIKFLHKSNKRPRISCAYMFWILIQPHYNTVRTSAEKARNCGIYRQRRVQIKSANIVVALTRWQNSWMPTTAINKCNSKAAVHSNQKNLSVWILQELHLKTWSTAMCNSSSFIFRFHCHTLEYVSNNYNTTHHNFL